MRRPLGRQYPQSKQPKSKRNEKGDEKFMVKVLIGIPCMDTVPVEFCSSFASLDCPKKEHIMISNSLVYDARNKIADYAIEGGFEYLLFIDSDMVFPADGLNRLLIHNKDIVGGLYFGRRGKHEPIAFKEVIPRTHFHYPSCKPIDCLEDVQEVQGMGLGFCLIKVEVLKKIRKRYKSIFEPIKGLGEDLAFEYKARKMGYKIYCDCDIELYHVAQTKIGRNDYEFNSR